jgi:hypothetical protein
VGLSFVVSLVAFLLFIFTVPLDTSHREWGANGNWETPSRTTGGQALDTGCAWKTDWLDRCSDLASGKPA